MCEDTLPKISSNNFVKANGIKMLTLKGTYADIKDELPFEEGQKVNGKGVDFKITIQDQNLFGQVTKYTYYHLESMIELGMREHFYTNRLQKEMYVVDKPATREGGYGLVVYEDGYIKNVKMEKLYILKKDSTVEKITAFTVLKKGLVGAYDKIIPDGWGDIENLNKADEALGTVSGYSFSNKTTMTVTVRLQGNKCLVRANAEQNNKTITEPLAYQNFFNALAQSLFLTANDVL